MPAPSSARGAKRAWALLDRQINADVDTGSLLFPDVDTNASGYRFKLFADKYDNPYFPRSGHAAQISVFTASSALGADDSYNRVELHARRRT